MQCVASRRILPASINRIVQMPHSPEDKKKAMARVRRIRGQLDALERALETGADCAPVLQQLAAIRQVQENGRRLEHGRSGDGRG